ncbi:MAG: hypothetical protein H0W61_09145 [Bacteroidetes bacterium]|nr:hypothetical protein [Bacteroidota bacterium]
MKPDFQISIPNPCNANWDKMTPTNSGKHCASCDKTVVDFTKLTTEQIKDHFNKNNARTCGHFYKGQLKLDKNKFQTFLTDLYCEAYLNLKTKAIRVSVLLILSSVLTLAGCNTPTQGEMIVKNHSVTRDSISTSIMDSSRVDSLKK